MNEPVHVFLSLPNYGGIDPETMVGVIMCGGSESIKATFKVRTPDSLLARGFNYLYSEALNGRKQYGYTHFAMVHSDVGPEHGWLAKMITEQQRLDCGILSAVIPIKTKQGFTSTGVYDPATQNIERLKLRYTLQLPLTFGREDVTSSDKMLVVNTGLLLIDIRKPFVDATEEIEGCKFLKCHFEIKDSILVQDDGTYDPRGLSEDWHYSVMAAREGATIYATHKIEVTHYGRYGFKNTKEYFDSWGE